MSLRDQWQQVRLRNDEVVRRSVNEVMRDHRYDRLRTRQARNALVAVTTLALLAVPVAFAAVGTAAGVLAVIVTAVLWQVLGLSVRKVPDLPDVYLDERQLALQRRVYTEAYRWLSVVMTLTAASGLVTFMALGMEPRGGALEVTWDQAMGGFWFVSATVLVLPVMVHALRDREQP